MIQEPELKMSLSEALLIDLLIGIIETLGFTGDAVGGGEVTVIYILEWLKSKALQRSMTTAPWRGDCLLSNKWVGYSYLRRPE